jgi:hypothetical protein
MHVHPKSFCGCSPLRWLFFVWLSHEVVLFFFFLSFLPCRSFSFHARRGLNKKHKKKETGLVFFVFFFLSHLFVCQDLQCLQ